MYHKHFLDTINTNITTKTGTHLLKLTKTTQQSWQMTKILLNELTSPERTWRRLMAYRITNNTPITSLRVPRYLKLCGGAAFGMKIITKHSNSAGLWRFEFDLEWDRRHISRRPRGEPTGTNHQCRTHPPTYPRRRAWRPRSTISAAAHGYTCETKMSRWINFNFSINSFSNRVLQSFLLTY